MKDPSGVIQPAGCTILDARWFPPQLHGVGRVQLTRSLGVMGKVAPVEQRHRHLQHLLHQFSRGSRAETPQGSLPACASGHVASTTGATRIRPITGRHSLFPTPIPAPPLVGLTASLPCLRKGRYGLTTFHKVDTDGEGALYSPVAWRVHDREVDNPCTLLRCPFGSSLSASLACCLSRRLSRVHMCSPLPSILVPSPPDAGRDTVPSRFRCQSSDCGSVVRGLLTARYLAAVPRRILLMEQQVWSVQHARQSTLRPRVADPRKAGQVCIGQVL